MKANIELKTQKRNEIYQQVKEKEKKKLELISKDIDSKNSVSEKLLQMVNH